MSVEPFWHDGSVSIWHADARALPLTTGTVDLVVTSPPFYSLRSYTDGGQHWAGQIGDEPTPGEYLDNLLDVTRERARALEVPKPPEEPKGIDSLLDLLELEHDERTA